MDEIELIYGDIKVSVRKVAEAGVAEVVTMRLSTGERRETKIPIEKVGDFVAGIFF